MSVKLFSSTLVLNEILARYSNLVVHFPLSVLKIYPDISFWPTELLLKDQLLCIYFPCMYLLLFPCCFNILSLCLVFVSLISVCLDVFLCEFILYGALCASWMWLTISFSMLGKFSNIISSKFFSYAFFFSSSSVTPVIRMLVHLILYQRFLRLS